MTRNDGIYNEQLGAAVMAAVVVTDDVRTEFARYLIYECGLSPATALTYDQALKRIERICGKDATDVTSGEMRWMMRNAQWSPATTNITLVGFKAFDRFLILEEQRKPSAIGALRAPKMPRQPRHRPLSPDEAREVLDYCWRPNDFRAIWLPLFAGLRVAEAASIREREWERLGRLRFVGKGRKEREVPVHPELLGVRDKILDGRATRSGLQNICRSISHLSGHPFSPHTLRHTFSATLRDLGIRPEVRGSLLGHSPLSVTEAHYGEVTWQVKQEAIATLRYERNGEKG